MPGPWEQFQQSSEAKAPWEQFKTQEPQQAPAAQPQEKSISQRLLGFLKPGSPERAALGSGALEGLTLGNVPFTQYANVQPSEENIAKAGKFGGEIATAAMMPGEGIVGSALGGAALGAATKPEEGGSRLANAGLGALLGGAFAGAGKTLEAPTDWMAQKAAGFKKYIPGAGKTIMEYISPGTRQGMADQALAARNQVGKELENTVNALPGTINPQDVSNSVAELKNKYISPEGHIRPTDQPQINAIEQRASSIANQNPLTASEAQFQKSRAGNEAYSLYSAKDTAKAEISRAEERAFNDHIEAMARSSSPADAERYQMLKDKYGPLATAAKEMKKPESIKADYMPLALRTLGGAGLGYAYGGGDPATMAAGAVGINLMRQPGAQLSLAKILSSMGRGLQTAGPTLVPPMLGGLKINERR